MLEQNKNQTSKQVPWYLIFPDDDESKYQKYFFQTNIGFIRLSFIAATVATVIFISVSFSMMRERIENVDFHLLSFGCLLLLSLIAMWLSYQKYFQKKYDLIIFVLFVLTYFTLMTTLSVLPIQYRYSSYGSFMYILLLNYGLLRQKFSSALINGLIGSGIFLIGTYVAGTYPISVFKQIGAYFLLFNFGGASVTYILERSQRAAFLAKEALEAEHERAENLLLNILPFPIAARLKSNQECIADHIEEASVMFIDIVGFCERTRQSTPEVLVKFLDHLFTEFDAIMDKHGIEKIKTIGDSYMAASGIQGSTECHTERLAAAALDVMSYIGRSKSGVVLRIGIHTGSVIAGVIGRKKMIYDLWGDTVNIASRMESHSIAGKIQVSDSVVNMLKDTFTFSELRTITVKGQGQMRVAFLLDKTTKKTTDQ
jgi:adenylate cyclase